MASSSSSLSLFSPASLKGWSLATCRIISKAVQGLGFKCSSRVANRSGFSLLDFFIHAKLDLHRFILKIELVWVFRLMPGLTPAQTRRERSPPLDSARFSPSRKTGQTCARPEGADLMNLFRHRSIALQASRNQRPFPFAGVQPSAPFRSCLHKLPRLPDSSLRSITGQRWTHSVPFLRSQTFAFQLHLKPSQPASWCPPGIPPTGDGWRFRFG